MKMRDKSNISKKSTTKYEIVKDDEDFRKSQQESIKKTVDSAGKFFEGGKRLTWAGALYILLGVVFFVLVIYFFVALYFEHENALNFVSIMNVGYTGSDIVCEYEGIKYYIDKPNVALEFQELFNESVCYLEE